ncbi:MAG: FAD-binding oxidoreductase [Polaromonas sp.]|nr:FAD-binding oxidoreductase [Polaromonas sp.]
MSTLPPYADVVIIGGGITGCATAYYLSRLKLSVALLERGEVANEQSSRAWGFIRKQGRHPAEIPMAAEASRLWSTLSHELQADLEYVRKGILTPASSEADEEIAQQGARLAAGHGLSTRFVSAADIRTLLPQMQGQWRGGLYTPDDGHGEPVKTTRAFANAAVNNGARLFQNIGASRIEVSNQRVTAVDTRQGRIRTGAVLCAAGMGSGNILKQVGLSLPIHGIRITVLETQPATPFTELAVWAPQVAFRPTRRGTFYVSSGYRAKTGDLDVTLDGIRHFGKFFHQLRSNPTALNIRVGMPLLRSLDTRIDDTAQAEPPANARIAAYNLRQFLAAFPHLGPLQPMRTWAGQIDATPDMIPVIDTVPGIPNFHVATGFSGHGFALGPVSGKLLSEQIATGAASLDLHAFRISRFAEGDMQLSPYAL